MTINTINTANTVTIANTANAANKAAAANTADTPDSAGGASANDANAATGVTAGNNTASAIVTITAGNTTGQTGEVVTTETTQTGHTADTAQVQNSGSGKEVAASQAFAVALKGAITTELSEFGRLVAARTAAIQSLPPQIRELVQQVLSQNQAAQTTLTEGLVSLLKSPKTITENLTTLIDLMESASGLSTNTQAQTELTPQTAGNNQKASAALVTAWPGATPEEVTSAAKVLRELAVLLQPADELAKQQEPTTAMPRTNTVANTQPDRLQMATSQQPHAQLPEKPTTTAPLSSAVMEEQGETLPGGKGNSQTTNINDRTEVSQRQQLTTVKPSNLEASSAVVVKNTAAQPLPQNSQTLQGLQQLPQELKEFVLKLIQQETPSAVNQTTQKTQQAAQNPQPLPSNLTIPPGQTVQTQPGTSLPLPQTTTAVGERQGQVQQANMPLSQMQAAVTPALQTVPQQQVSVVLGELITTLNKSNKTPAEKTNELANFLEQVLDTVSSQGTGKQLTAHLRQQAMMEMAEILQDKTPEELKAAIKVVRDLAETMGKPSGVTAERQEGQKVLTMAVPLYFGEGQTVYPAYIHVYYQQEEDKKNPGQKVTETWLRVCLETENIGIVDAAFRLYDEDKLDVKVRFAEEEAATGFSQNLEEVKEELKKLPLILGDFLVK